MELISWLGFEDWSCSPSGRLWATQRKRWYRFHLWYLLFLVTSSACYIVVSPKYWILKQISTSFIVCPFQMPYLQVLIHWYQSLLASNGYSAIIVELISLTNYYLKIKNKKLSWFVRIGWEKVPKEGPTWTFFNQCLLSTWHVLVYCLRAGDMVMNNKEKNPVFIS